MLYNPNLRMAEAARDEDFIVFKSDALRVTANLFDGDAIYVTFASAVGVGFHNKGFAEDFLKSRGISVICVVPRTHSWYQHREIIEACRAIRAITKTYDRVITYGSSMGGYAALNFAELVGATDVIAISPQYTIDPARAPEERRYSNGFPGMDDGFIYDQPADRDWSNTNACILYDPIDKLDAYQAGMALSEIPAVLVRLPHSTHPCTQVLSVEGLKNLVMQTASDGVLAALPALRSTYRRDRGNSWYYWLNLARNHGAVSPKRAMTFIREADRLHPENKDVHYVIGNLSIALGRYNEAVEAFTRCASWDHENPWHHAGKAKALIAMGAPVQAKAAISEGEALGLPPAEIERLTKGLRKAHRIKVEQKKAPEPQSLLARLIRFFMRLQPGQ